MSAENSLCAKALVNALCDPLPVGQSLQVVVSPGARSTPLVLAFANEKRCRLHVVLDERTAAFFALGLSQRSGCAAVTLCTSGSAAAHGVPAAMEAHHAGVPLIVITADRPPEMHGVCAPQTSDQSELYRRHARAVLLLATPIAGDKAEPASMALSNERVTRSWALAGVRAWHSAHGRWPGPVHINAPFREPLGTQAAAANASLPAPRLFAADGSRPCPDAVAHLLATVGTAQRGVIVCGPLLPSTGGTAPFSAALAAFAACSGWPILAEATAGLAGAVRRPVATFDAILRQRELADALAPDAVLQVGLAPASRALQRWLARSEATVIGCTPPEVVMDVAGRTTAMVQGDVGALLAAAAAALGTPSALQAAYAARWRDAEARAHAAVKAIVSGDGAFFSGRAIVAAIDALRDHGAIVIGNSLAVRDLTSYAALPSCSSPIFARRGVSGIDGAIAHAAGVCAVATARRTACLVGDLTFWYDAQSLRLAAEFELPLDVVVFDNAGGQIFAELPIRNNAAVFEPYFLTPQRSANARATTVAMGACFVLASDEAELRAALQCFANASVRGPRVVWVDLPRDDHLRRSEASAQVAAALAAAPRSNIRGGQG